MKQTQKRHSSLFLIELMFCLLFFSLAAAVSIQFFIEAHVLSQKSVNLNEAILISESLADEFRATRGEISGQTLLYNEDWDMVAELTDARFVANFSVTQTEDQLRVATVIVGEISNVHNVSSLLAADSFDLIYELEVIVCP